MKRTKRGASLVELLIAISLFGFLAAILTQLAINVTTASIKISNKTLGQEAARTAMNRMLADIRQARSIGDFYGAGGKFPAPTNPIYGALPPTGGWPGPPWNPNMTLTPQVLVIQIPVFYQDKDNPDIVDAAKPPNPFNGFPTMLRLDPAKPSLNVENLDTVVYQVVPDLKKPEEYVLQVARFPGVKMTSLNNLQPELINPPQTILKGLVGPKVGGGTVPNVFTYFGRPQNIGPYRKITPSAGTEARGVGIDMEIRKLGDDQATVSRFPEYIGIHQEAFVGANTNMTLVNDR